MHEDLTENLLLLLSGAESKFFNPYSASNITVPRWSIRIWVKTGGGSRDSQAWPASLEQTSPTWRIPSVFSSIKDTSFSVQLWDHSFGLQLILTCGLHRLRSAAQTLLLRCIELNADVLYPLSFIFPTLLSKDVEGWRLVATSCRGDSCYLCNCQWDRFIKFKWEDIHTYILKLWSRELFCEWNVGIQRYFI